MKMVWFELNHKFCSVFWGNWNIHIGVKKKTKLNQTVSKKKLKSDMFWEKAEVNPVFIKWFGLV